MKKDLTEIICVIDKSGSMGSKRSDAIGGFNRFLEDQKKEPGDAKFTLTLFDTEYKIVHNGTDIQAVSPLNEATYVPGGCTALLDAVGRTIDKVGERLTNTPENDRPERVIVVILTDGLENASKEYTRQQILDKITHQQEKYGWVFLYLGSDIQDVQFAQSVGVANVAFGNATGQGVMVNYVNTSKCVRGLRSGVPLDESAWRITNE